ncbi:hypothetical protein CSUNSWCD_142 [Campylobacter showae CSUNSWCD]|uniref:Uncharacterized protein n=1 Tax=Campylobacter showae CSUNSWCD TaxID=1244083 RepID=M5II21_9BACT|nr:hypothetical protein CSUNSWCD_142 [Campylobacter showae CSUNSWCD]
MGLDDSYACIWRVNLRTDRLPNLRSKSKSKNSNFTPND